jgi:hypothetical protein
VGNGLIPESEPLRLAIAWLAGQPTRSREQIEQASQRFGLSPLDAAVLFRFFSTETTELYNKDQ